MRCGASEKVRSSADAVMKKDGKHQMPSPASSRLRGFSNTYISFEWRSLGCSQSFDLEVPFLILQVRYDPLLPFLKSNMESR